VRKPLNRTVRLHSYFLQFVISVFIELERSTRQKNDFSLVLKIFSPVYVYVKSKETVKRVLGLIVLKKNEISSMEVEKISPVAKYRSHMANLIEAGIASGYFVFSFGFRGHFSGGKF
jgi:hypothetical protein